MLGILPFVSDDGEASRIVNGLLAAVPPGSYLAITDSTSEVSGERVIEAVRQWNQVAVTPYTLRSPGQIAAFFTAPSGVRALSAGSRRAESPHAGPRSPCLARLAPGNVWR
jgi:hypothetical protein